MAVFTALTPAQLLPWLQYYSIGQCIGLCGITSGIENSNYFLTTTRGAYVLTIFERLATHEISFYLDLMRHLAAHKMPVPAPVVRADGALFGLLCGKPAALVSRLSGAVQTAPTSRHCAEVGQMLARMHVAASRFSGAALQNPRGLIWQRDAAQAVKSFLTPDQRALLQTELAFQEGMGALPEYAQLPAGICHGDLFRDNVFFATQPDCVGDPYRLSGFFDFYFGGVEKWLFDVAVCVNDWCIMPESGQLDKRRVHAFLNAYHAVRAFTPVEASYWSAMLRAAALRFWLSRLYDFYLPRQAKMLRAHDPTHFERILRMHLQLDSDASSSLIQLVHPTPHVSS